MGLTTDIYDDVDKRNLRLAAQAAARNRPVAAQPDTEGRSFGFQSGANRPGGVAERHLSLAAAAGKELGEPTSFSAGAGAPTPIGVIRGMTPTYATDTGGPFLQEFATPLQAQQAFNRERLRKDLGEVAAMDIVPKAGEDLRAAATARFGGWRAPGQTIEEVRAAKEPPGTSELRQVQAKFFEHQIAELQKKNKSETEAQNTADFQTQWKNQYAGPTPKKGGVGFDYTWPTDRGMMEDFTAAHEVARTAGPQAGMQHFQQSQQVRQYEPLFTPENLASFRATLPPQIQQSPVFSDAYLNAIRQNPQAWREMKLHLGPRLQQLQSKSPPTGKLGVSPFWGKVIPRQTEETPPPF